MSKYIGLYISYTSISIVTVRYKLTVRSHTGTISFNQMHILDMVNY